MDSEILIALQVRPGFQQGQRIRCGSSIPFFQRTRTMVILLALQVRPGFQRDNVSGVGPVSHFFLAWAVGTQIHTMRL